MSPIEIFLAALRKKGCDPRPCGDGWDARCPGLEHGVAGDQNRALFVTEAIDGSLIIDCHGDEPAADIHAQFPLDCVGGVS